MIVIDASVTCPIGNLVFQKLDINEGMPMKGLFHTALYILLTIVLSGCIQDIIVINVKPDGSGTIDETSLLSNSMFDMMESVAGSMTGPSREGGMQDNNDATIGKLAKRGEADA